MSRIAVARRISGVKGGPRRSTFFRRPKKSEPLTPEIRRAAAARAFRRMEWVDAPDEKRLGEGPLAWDGVCVTCGKFCTTATIVSAVCFSRCVSSCGALTVCERRMPAQRLHCFILPRPPLFSLQVFARGGLPVKDARDPRITAHRRQVWAASPSLATTRAPRRSAFTPRLPTMRALAAAARSKRRAALRIAESTPASTKPFSCSSGSESCASFTRHVWTDGACGRSHHDSQPPSAAGWPNREATIFRVQEGLRRNLHFPTPPPAPTPPSSLRHSSQRPRRRHFRPGRMGPKRTRSLPRQRPMKRASRRWRN